MSRAKGDNHNVVVRPGVIRFLAEHLVEPHPVAAQAMMAEFGEPLDVSVVRQDGSLVVYFTYSSRAVDCRSILVPHSWRFESMESAIAFREAILPVPAPVRV